MSKPTTPKMEGIDVASARSFARSQAPLERPGTARSQKFFKFYPESVEFHDFEAGQQYVGFITVRNDSQLRRKIRVSNPSTPNFKITVINDDPGFLSPGLSLKIKVAFSSQDALQSLHDALIIQGDGEGGRPLTFQVPLHARAFAPRIVFNNFVNFQTVVVNTSTIQHVKFTNEGKKEGGFKISWFEDTPLKCTPSEAVLAPGHSIDVKLELNAAELGVAQYRGQVDFSGFDDPTPPAYFDVKGNVVKESLELVMPGRAAGPVNDIDFGSVYYGQTRMTRGYLVNNSPLPATFAISMSEGKSDEPNMSDSDDGDNGGSDMAHPDVLVIPSEGRLAPYSKVELSFIFQPTIPPSMRGWASQDNDANLRSFATTARVETTESKQRLSVQLTGKAMAPNVRLSMQDFYFGECPVNERRDIIVTLTNKCPTLPAAFDFTKVAQFAVNPAAGKLLPLQSRDVMVSFIPHNMGRHSNTIPMQVEGGIQSFNLLVKGESNKSSAPKKKIAGTKLPVDFKPSYTFIDPSVPLPTRSKPKFNGTSTAIGMKETYADLRKEDYESRYAFPMEEFEAKRNNINRANGYLRGGYERKEQAAIKARALDPMDEVSMGIKFGEGLAEPKLHLPEPEGKLWLQYDMGGYTGQTRHKPNPKGQRDSTRKSKNFKSEPTTQAERRDCETPLSHQDLQKISRGPKNLDFGQLFIDAHSSKAFSVTNQLEQHIMCVMNVADVPELAQSSGLSQMIPPGKTAQFDLMFQSGEVQEFKRAVTYTINGHHNYTVTAACEVVPVALQLDREEVYFSFTGDNTTFSAFQQLQLVNPSNVNVDFWFTSDNEAFSVTPSKGTLGVFKTDKVTISYSPQFAQKKTATEVWLNVKNGPKRKIVCHASLAEASCAFKQRDLDLGVMHVGQADTHSVVLRNNGRSKTVFKVDQLPEGVLVNPMTQLLAAGQSTTLQVTVFMSEAQTFKHTVTVDVRGKSQKSKPATLVLTGKAVVADVEVMESDFDFGGVTIGSSRNLPLTIINRGSVPATLYLDLASHPEFSLKFPSDWLKAEVCPIKIITSEEATFAVDGRLHTTPLTKEEPSEGEVCAHRLTVPADSQLGVELVYTPTKVRSHSIAMPLGLAGIRAYAGTRRVIVASGIKPRVLLTKRSVEFSRRVVMKPDRALKSPYCETFEMRNDDLTDLEWSLKLPERILGLWSDGEEHPDPVDDDANNAARQPEITWRVEPTSGTLLPGQSTTVTVFFSPVFHKHYSFPLNLFLAEQGMDKPYFQIQVSGAGTFPMLSFDQEEVMLPVVPLGMVAKASFKILNHGYESLELRYHLPHDTSRVPLTVAFPEGSTLGIGREEVPVEVTFYSKKAMSFTANLDFLDTDGNKFTLPVTGVTDNCLLTLQEFIDPMRLGVDIRAKPGQGCFLHQRTKMELEKIFSEQVKGEQDFADATNTDADALAERSIYSVLAYLESSGLIPVSQDLAASARNFPAQFIESNGKVIFDLVKVLSGKNPLAGKAAPQDKKKSAPALDLVESFQAMLTFLKANGALVNSCKAQHFLSQPQFLRVLKGDNSEELEDDFNQARRIQAEKAFPTRSRQTWATTLLQIVRVFILSRVTPKQFRSIAGISPEQTVIEPATLTSNVYSPGEAVLLHWLSHHFGKNNPHIFHRVVNFDRDLSDGLVLAAALQSHSPNLKSLNMLAPSKDQAARLENCKKLCAALKELGLNYAIEPKDIMAPTARNLSLFVLFLYQKLPAFIPKTIIEFRGALDQEIVKHIELVNPSKKPVHYAVRLEGSNDFAIDASELTLEPKGRNGSAVNFKVRFRSRFSRSVEGRLVFSSDGDGANASTLVFLLKSEIVSRTSLETHEVSSPCYEEHEVGLSFTNPFSDDCNFKLQVLATQEPQSSNPQPPKGTANGKKPVRRKSVADEMLLPVAFFCKLERLKVRANETVVLPLQFLPLRIGTYRCQIVFLDDNIGELMHEVVGEGLMPEPLDTLKWNLLSKTSITKDVPISLRNPLLDKARQVTVDRLNVMSRKQRDLLKAGSDKRMQVLKPDFIPDVNTYTITSSSNFFVCPPTITLTASAESGEKAPALASTRNAGKDAEFSVPVQFNPRAPGTYKAELTLQSPFDVRVLFLDVVVKEETETPTLEFRVSAGETLVQEIPIVNNSDEMWQLKCNLSDSTRSFSGPSDIVVQAKSQEMYKLKFCPEWTTEVQGKLEMTNARNGDKHGFNLMGFGEEPLALEHIEIECQAREQVVQMLTVYNKSPSEVTYAVESDLPNISGESTIRVGPGSQAQYKLLICPQLGGLYNGSVTFLAPDKRFQWYAIQLTASSPAPEASLEVKAFLRKAAAVQISMTNPLDEVLAFDVRLEANGLFGDPVMTLGPKETGTYEFVFSPLVAGIFNGAVSFVNEKAGEFWYNLMLIGETPSPTVLPDMHADVGNRSQQVLTIDNPTSEAIVLRGTNSNPRNFAVSPAVLNMKPYQSLDVTVTYTPSAIDEWQTAELGFKHPTVGEWMYEVRGQGDRPKKMPATTVFAAIGSRASNTIMFRNPFTEPISVDISMVEDTSNSPSNAFELFLKRSTIQLAPQASTQIPFIFQPSLIQSHSATIFINSPDLESGVQWTYPIKGVGEGATATHPIVLSCQARAVFEDVITVRLQGNVPNRLEHYSCEVDCDEESRGWLGRAVSFEMVTETLRSQTSEQEVQLRVKFEPLKPVSAEAFLVINKRSGGRWRFPLNLLASEPDLDDVIRVEAMIHTSSSVSFQLNNQFEIFSDFTARLTPESASEFKVYPSTGILEPMSSQDGTQFVVSFSPTEYGKTYFGKLVIETEDMQWTYEIRGTHPRYVIPRGHATVDSRADPAMLRPQDERASNFLSRNAKAAKEQKLMSPKAAQQRGRGRKSRKRADIDRAALSAKAHGGKITVNREFAT